MSSFTEEKDNQFQIEEDSDSKSVSLGSDDDDSLLSDLSEFDSLYDEEPEEPIVELNARKRGRAMVDMDDVRAHIRQLTAAYADIQDPHLRRLLELERDGGQPEEMRPLVHMLLTSSNMEAKYKEILIIIDTLLNELE